MNRLVLASRSPARAKMLRDAGVKVDVRPSPLDEDEAKRPLKADRLEPALIAQRLAAAKALAVPADPHEWVLGADQTLELDGDLMEKPGTLSGLRSQLQKLRGTHHDLHAAGALVRGGHVLWQSCSSVRVTMRMLLDEEIERYVRGEGRHVLNCVGGYRLEGPGVQLLTAVEGDYFSVLGLPLLGTLAALRASGFRS